MSVPVGLSAPLIHAWLKAQTALGVPFEDVTEEFLGSALEELRDAKAIKATEAIQALAAYKKLKQLDPEQRAVLLSTHLAAVEHSPAPALSAPFAAAPLDLSFVDPVAPLPPASAIFQMSPASLSLYPSGSPASSVIAPSPQSAHSLAATPSSRPSDPSVYPSPSLSRPSQRVPSLAVGGPSPAYRSAYDVEDLSASFSRGLDPYLGAHSLSQSSASVYDRSYFSASDADEILPPTNHRSSSRDPEAEPVSSQSPSARSSASIRSTGSAPVSVRSHIPASHAPQVAPAPTQPKPKPKPPSAHPSHAKPSASKEAKVQPDAVRKDPDGFTVVLSKKTAKASPSGRAADEKAEKNPQCPARCKCKKRLECPLKHSQAERRIFALMDVENNEKVKTNLCYQFKDGVHCMWGRDHCKGAHGREDGWCSYCGQCGHFVVECALLANQPKRTPK